MYGGRMEKISGVSGRQELAQKLKFMSGTEKYVRMSPELKKSACNILGGVNWKKRTIKLQKEK